MWCVTLTVPLFRATMATSATEEEFLQVLDEMNRICGAEDASSPPSSSAAAAAAAASGLDFEESGEEDKEDSGMSSDQSPENRLGATTRTYGGVAAPEEVLKVGEAEGMDDSSDLSNSFLQVMNPARLGRGKMQFCSCTCNATTAWLVSLAANLELILLLLLVLHFLTFPLFSLTAAG